VARRQSVAVRELGHKGEGDGEAYSRRSICGDEKKL
jgi:hypothetical protein